VVQQQISTGGTSAASATRRPRLRLLPAIKTKMLGDEGPPLGVDPRFVSGNIPPLEQKTTVKRIAHHEFLGQPKAPNHNRE
jgi:hypothetical protein